MKIGRVFKIICSDCGKLREPYDEFSVCCDECWVRQI